MSRQRNMNLTLGLTAIWGCASSIWNTALLSNWLFLLTDSNTKVGIVTAANGMAVLLSALPVGAIADKYSKSLTIRVGACLTILAVASTIFAVTDTIQLNYTQQYNILLASMCLWGIVNGIVNGPVQALFADSCPLGDRSEWYSYLQICYLVPSAVGPAISVVMFSYMGANWEFDDMRMVFVTGLLIQSLSIPLLLGLRDLPKATAQPEDSDPSQSASKVSDKGLDAPLLTNLEGPDSNNQDIAVEGGLQLSNKTWLCLKQSHIPYILFFGDLVTALGSGMTVAFFPLFFKNDIGLDPVQVNVIYIVVPIVIALLGALLQFIAKRVLGRIWVSVLSRWIGLSCLLAMVQLLEVYDETRWYIYIYIYIYIACFSTS